MSKVFVALKTPQFNDFLSNEKTYELRGCERNYTPKYVLSGKQAEIRKGYSGDRRTGTIGCVVVENSIDRIFEKVDFKKIFPRANSLEEAKENAKNIMKHKESYIAFEIILSNTQITK